MPLKISSFVYDRKPRGAIHIRFSVHWFNERSVVTSYLSSPKNQVALNTVSIPCSDPKKFRNMVYTLHGEDLPGKYSPRAFQSIMREVALYRVQLEYQCRHLINDTMMYKRPFISLYLFLSWMHCVYLNSVVYVPPYVIGFFVLHLFRNYRLYCSNYSGYSGYKPISLSEIFNALIYGCGESGKLCGTWMEPLVMPKPQKEKSSSMCCVNRDTKDTEKQGADHVEFPFSEKQTYQKRTLEENLATKARINIASDNIIDSASDAKMNHLSTTSAKLEKQNKDGECNYNESENEDDELIFDPNDSDDESDYDIFGHNLNSNIPVIKPGQSFPVGPQQNVDMISKKPVQVRKLLGFVERSLHGLTGNIFDEEIYHFQSLSEKKEILQTASNSGISKDEVKKAHKNEFVKRLGQKKKSSNPIVSYSAQYLEPIMSIIRIYLSAVRLIFNVAVWKDPILSFWLLIFLILQMGVLIVFPWRFFFFFLGLFFFGPQNLMLRLMSSTKPENLDSAEFINVGGNEEVGNSKVQKARDILSRSKLKFSRVRTKKDTEKSALVQPQIEISQPNLNVNAMSADDSIKKEVATCNVLVPYGRSRVDRFYYWPPDPSFSSSKQLSCEDINSMTEDDTVVFTEINLKRT